MLFLMHKRGNGLVIEGKVIVMNVRECAGAMRQRAKQEMSST
jgi:hypothetical protein